jgi:hypothetical protein
VITKISFSLCVYDQYVYKIKIDRKQNIPLSHIDKFQAVSERIDDAVKRKELAAVLIWQHQ